MARASASDRAEIRRGKGSARDKREAKYPDVKKHKRPSSRRHPNRRKNG